MVPTDLACQRQSVIVWRSSPSRARDSVPTAAITR
jgi:hypothetical protein